MKDFLLQDNGNGNEIMEQLQSSGIMRKKGEEQLFNRYYYFVRVGMAKYLLTEDESFNAYSDAVLAAIDSITNETFQQKASLKTFLTRIFQNKCVDAVRKRRTRKHSVYHTLDINGIFMHLPDNAPGILEKMVKQAEVEELAHKLNRLSGRSQRLLQLSAEGYSDKEIAAEMNFKTRDVVRTTRQRSIQALRQLSRAC